MCGLFGAIGKFEEDKVKILGILNESRGGHSTGLYDGEYLYKDASPASKALIDKVMLKAFNNNAKFIMGHTRYATHGAKTAKNAHPFSVGNIVGAHNGIIYNFDVKQKLQKTKFEVDSQIAFNTIENYGFKGLDFLSGYWGLTWTDATKKDKFYITRHSQELSVLRTKDCIYYSSDEEHLQMIQKKGDKLFSILPDTVYEIDVNSLTIDKIGKYSPVVYAVSTNDRLMTTGQQTFSSQYEGYNTGGMMNDMWESYICENCEEEIFTGERMYRYLGLEICQSCKEELILSGTNRTQFEEVITHV